MIKIATYLTLIFLIFFSSQNHSKATENDVPEFYLFVDEVPKFGNSDQDLYNYLYSNVKWPKLFDGSGEVLVSLVIDRKGLVADVRIEKELCEPCAAEVKRVMLGMPAWEPGKKNNIPVAVKIYIPFQFIIK